MKKKRNLWVIPTDKPSRLHITSKLMLYPNGLMPKSQGLCKNQNIYVTNDENIKEGCYVISTYDKWRGDGKLKPQIGKILEIHDDYYLIDSFNGDTDNKWGKGHSLKIILTTDLDLIKDGVQAIDDEFLEWFVKNPSCEFVEVEKIRVISYSFPRNAYDKYRITIPKEEPKQEFPKQNIIDNWLEKNGDAEIDKQVEQESKCLCEQETLEDAAIDYSKMYFSENKKAELGFIAGAKWQQEQDKNKYSEEEVLSLLNKREDYINSEDNIFEYQSITQWFKQFKKK